MTNFLGKETKIQRGEWYVKGHISSERQKWDSDSDLPASRIYTFVPSSSCLIKEKTSATY